MKDDTSWGKVADWYEENLRDDDSYQAKVILPNLVRLLDLKKSDSILDLACGTGFFTKEFAKLAGHVVGADLGAELIEKAKKENPGVEFFVTPSKDLSVFPDASFDKVVIVLAIQNIREVKETLLECKRVLKPNGKLFVVLNHPAFRIPGASSWVWEGERQYRRIDSYLTETSHEIDMNPGSVAKNKEKTVSFHRPIQYYIKLASNAGFKLDKLEEWVSHKKSQKGPRQIEEDRVRREFPLFMFLGFGL